MPLPTSFDGLISNNSTYGPFTRAHASAETAASPAANTTSGYISIHRCARSFTVPSMTGPSEAFVTYADLTYGGNTSLPMMALEYDLGSLNMAGTNSSSSAFTSGVSMPTKTIEGTSITTASLLVVATATAAVTATTPTLAITYTDQDGNTGQSASMTLPTSPVLNTGYLVNRHLASGDTGIRAITSATKSAGTAGTITFKGLLPLAFGITGQSLICGTLPPLATPFPMFPVEAADVISFWIFNSAAAQDFIGAFTLEAGV